MNLRKFLMYVAAMSFGLSALLGVIALLGMSGRLMEKMVLTSLTFSYFCLTSYACAFVVDQRRARFIAWSGIVWSIALLGWTVSFIWIDRKMSAFFPGYWEGEFTAVGLYTSSYFAHVSLLWLGTKLELRTAMIRWTATICATIALWYVVDLLMGILNFNDDFYERLGGVVAIIAACTSIVLPIFHRLDRLRRENDTKTLNPKVHVGCPRCGLNQDILAGRSERCTQCRLRIMIDVEEPRCSECGYLLYQLTSNACPECGHDVPFSEQWKPKSPSADIASSSDELDGKSPKTNDD